MQHLLLRLAGAVVGEPLFAESAKLIVESWVRICGAASATLVTPVDASTLLLTSCRPRSQDRLEFKSDEVRQPYSSLLAKDALIRMVPGGHPDPHPSVFQWPGLLSSLIVCGEPERLIEEAVCVLRSVTASLLARSVDFPVLFPSPQHLESMAEFAAGAGHEINNPLGSILGQTQLLLRLEGEIDKRQSLETIGSQAWRIRDMIGDAMLFARPPAATPAQADLVTVVQDAAVNTAANHTDNERHSPVDVEFRCSESRLAAEVDSTQIALLVSHLVRNGIESVRGTGQAGAVTVVLKKSRVADIAELLVRDSGPGIRDANVRRHLFDPFFSGRSAGRGLGFGLSLAWQVVRLHHGLMFQCNTPNDGGCEFHVALPLTLSSPA
ncbi:MAG: HAMP domain-containing histidine kinase [Planctomycetaceae bacterium]|nr:HAMP domain-containing histidine kinase [Planctomycetaceae bacterium]